MFDWDFGPVWHTVVTAGALQWAQRVAPTSSSPCPSRPCGEWASEWSIKEEEAARFNFHKMCRFFYRQLSYLDHCRSALQVLHKVCEVSRRYNYFPGGTALNWTTFYQSCISSEQSCINQWNIMTDLESSRTDCSPPPTYLDRWLVAAYIEGWIDRWKAEGKERRMCGCWGVDDRLCPPGLQSERGQSVWSEPSWGASWPARTWTTSPPNRSERTFKLGGQRKIQSENKK